MESIKSEVAMLKSPPVCPVTGLKVKIRPLSLPRLRSSSPESIVVCPSLVSIVSEASHKPKELALEVEPMIEIPAFSPLARKVMLSVDVLLGPSNAA